MAARAKAILSFSGQPGPGAKDYAANHAFVVAETAYVHDQCATYCRGLGGVGGARHAGRYLMDERQCK